MHFSANAAAVALLTAVMATQVAATPLPGQQLQPRFRVPKGNGGFRSVTAHPVYQRDVAAAEEAAELQARGAAHKLSPDLIKASYIPVKNLRPVKDFRPVRLSVRDSPADEMPAR